jgi:cytochrome c peroxidase
MSEVIDVARLRGCPQSFKEAPARRRLGAAAALVSIATAAFAAPDNLDAQLAIALNKAGFTGRVEAKLTSAAGLGRPIDKRLADLGRQLFFDPVHALHDDNTCAGCHAPNAGFGDTQSIAIGVQSNMVVGPHRTGPRNQRRTPTVVNTPFYPRLMWNGRFFAASGNAFDNSQPFTFPQPEGTTRFPANDPGIPQLLVAHAHMPPTELNEAAGFTGTKNTNLDPRFNAFDDGLGDSVPLPDASGFRNEPIRMRVVERLNASAKYVKLFGEIYPDINSGHQPVTVLMFAQAIAEFEFSMVRANAPIDAYARGDLGVLSKAEKRGALLFFGKANCVACHATAGGSNEMFSDFKNHNIGVPQIAPLFGVGKGNTIFDGPGEDEDYGNEQVTGDPKDRYMFRTSPLRNVALQPTFFHNGAFTRLEDAILHHLDAAGSARLYDAKKAGLDQDLTLRVAPADRVLATLDPLLAMPPRLTGAEVDDLVKFVGNGLLDRRANAESFCKTIPANLPSGMKPLRFEGCGK